MTESSGSITLHATRYGAPAYEVLRDVVEAIKHDDPLAPFTLIVPTNIAGITARRALAATTTSFGIGIAGLTVLTLDRLAELVAAPTLTADGRRPATGPVLSAAWRAALRDDAGLFAEVADHPATVTALVNAHRQVRDLSDGARAMIASSGMPLPADVIRLHNQVMARLSDRWYDSADLRTAAARETDAGPADLGAVVLFLPQDLDQASCHLVRRLAEHVRVHVIAAFAGQRRPDAGVLRTLTQLDVDVSALVLPDPPHATRIAHASDSDDEIRGVVRDVVTALDTTPAHRIAVLYGSHAPYARLLHEHLAAAGVTVNGPGVEPTSQRVVPRAMLALLELAEMGVDRPSLFRWLSSATVRTSAGKPVPTSRWERISRAAGVVGPDDWRPRLERYANDERARAEREKHEEAPREGIIKRRIGNAESAEALAEFVQALITRLDTGRSSVGWTALAAWAVDALHDLLWTERTSHWLSEDEAHAAERVERVLLGLSGLDAVESDAALRALRDVLELQLADDIPRTGRFGTGVLVAPLSSAVGLALDKVFVVGLAEGLCPSRVREDALLPDAVRALVSDELPAVRERLDRQHRHLLAAFAAAPDVTATFPRGDLRRSGDRLPSRWLLPSMKALSGDHSLAATRWSEATGNWLSGSPSYAATVVTTSRPATEQDWRMRALTAGAAGVPADPTLELAAALLAGRRSDDFTRYDGNLTTHAGTLPNPADGARVVSPTALESWVTCPHAYFLYRHLHVEAVEQPEELLTISPADRGSILHTALDEFFRALKDSGSIPPANQGWSVAQRAQLQEIGEDVANRYEQKGLTGHPTLWARERMLILDDLRRFLDLDEDARRGERRTQVASELKFGGKSPVVVTLPDGRSIRFAGSADRVDETDDGTLVVIDYKSGSARTFRGLSEGNPDLAGSKLQLPVYAYAARQLLGRPDAKVRAAYWFIGPKNRGEVVSLPLTEAVEERYLEVLTVIADGVAGGLFPANAPEDQPWLDWTPCPYCDPDGLGAKDRRIQWQRKKNDPVLASYVALIEPEAPEDVL